MSKWNHTICDSCWEDYAPEREPARLIGPAFDGEDCCFCGTFTTSGIYIRFDPESSLLKCNGGEKHAD